MVDVVDRAGIGEVLTQYIPAGLARAQVMELPIASEALKDRQWIDWFKSVLFLVSSCAIPAVIIWRRS